jgi:hypothetical protein
VLRQASEEVVLLFDTLHVLCQLSKDEDAVRGRDERDVQLPQNAREEAVGCGEALRVECDEGGELGPGQEVREVQRCEGVCVPVCQEGDGGEELGVLLGDEAALVAG